MAAENDEVTKNCSHCNRDILSFNYDLHSVHCQRNMERCSKCEEMVAKTRMKEHAEELHSLAPCPLCKVKMEKKLLLDHQVWECPSRLIHCDYCDLDKMASAFAEHSEVCGNRTDWCMDCGKWVKLNDRVAHDLTFHSNESFPSPVQADENSEDSPPQEARPMSSVGPGRPRLTQDALAAIAFSVVGVSFIVFHIFRRLSVPRRLNSGL